MKVIDAIVLFKGVKSLNIYFYKSDICDLEL